MAASISSDWLTTALGHDRLKREVIKEANYTTDFELHLCPSIDDCNYETPTNYIEVIQRFSPSEIYEEAPGWCNGPSVMEVCWRDDCEAIYLRKQIEYKDKIIRQICQDLDSFGEAGACFSGSLGQQFEACNDEARHNLDNSTSTDSQVAFVKDFGVCANRFIRAIPEPCQEDTKDFLIRFVDFCMSSQIDYISV